MLNKATIELIELIQQQKQHFQSPYAFLDSETYHLLNVSGCLEKAVIKDTLGLYMLESVKDKCLIEHEINKLRLMAKIEKENKLYEAYDIGEITLNELNIKIKELN
jgi:hypothetical protein